MEVLTWILVIALVAATAQVVYLSLRLRTTDEERALARGEAIRNLDFAVLHQRQAEEWKMVADEERALTRELFRAVRAPAPSGADWIATTTDASGEPMTVAQADRQAVESERRRREQEAAKRAERVAVAEEFEPEAPDLAGYEPVPILDAEASPVPRLTESYGGEDDDE